MSGVKLKIVLWADGDVRTTRGINLEIEDGEFRVCIGPPGYGKSTVPAGETGGSA